MKTCNKELRLPKSDIENWKPAHQLALLTEIVIQNLWLRNSPFDDAWNTNQSVKKLDEITNSSNKYEIVRRPHGRQLGFPFATNLLAKWIIQASCWLVSLLTKQNLINECLRNTNFFSFPTRYPFRMMAAPLPRLHSLSCFRFVSFPCHNYFYALSYIFFFGLNLWWWKLVGFSITMPKFDAMSEKIIFKYW